MKKGNKKRKYSGKMVIATFGFAITGALKYIVPMVALCISLTMWLYCKENSFMGIMSILFGILATVIIVMIQDNLREYIKNYIQSHNIRF